VKILWRERRRLAQKPRCDILSFEESGRCYISLFVRTSNRRQDNRASSVYLFTTSEKVYGQ
jgi:hypothetical protein